MILNFIVNFLVIKKHSPSFRGQGDNHGFQIALKRNNTSSGPLQKQSGKSCDFTSSSSREVGNVFANQMQGWPSWISNNPEKIQLNNHATTPNSGTIFLKVTIRTNSVEHKQKLTSFCLYMFC
jgi:hypothetical protein